MVGRLVAPPLAAALAAAATTSVAQRLCRATAFALGGHGARTHSARLRGSPAGATFGQLHESVLPALAAAAAVLPTCRRAASRWPKSRRRAKEDDSEGPSLASGVGADYTQLRDCLASGDFKAADAETRRMLIEIAGEAARKRGWVYFSEVKTIPVDDMKTLDGLWQHYSKGKFGFVAQRKIWRQCKSQFDRFAEQVSWFTDKWKNRNWPDEFIYDLTAPVGHLPLTNCIRGSQVLEEILAHPAYEKAKPKKSSDVGVAGLGLFALPGAPDPTPKRGPPMAGRTFTAASGRRW